MPHRRACACQSPACRKPFVKGDLRAYRPSRALAHRLYLCPSCVEGGLGSFESVLGADALPPDAQTQLR
eukprot:10728310-Alexandrium_andersonii.AAC.1